jgi:hypothetical protein
VVVAIARSAIAVIAVIPAIVVAGCGGDKKHEHVFTVADATRIANVRPAAPGWVWPQSPEKPVSSDSLTEAQSTDPLLVELKRQLADVVSVEEAGNKWKDDDKLANLDVGVYATSSDAHQAMAPFNAFSRGWGKRFGRVTRDEDIEGLGDEAWLLQVAGSGTGPEVTYHWRRDNIVLEAHVQCCGSCPDDIDAATRAWVDAIDVEARVHS